MKDYIDSVKLSDIKILKNIDNEFKNVNLDNFIVAKNTLISNLYLDTKIYRSVSINYKLNPKEVLLNREFIGKSWSYDFTFSHVMNNIYKDYGNTFIYQATLNPDTVNWLHTVALHMIPIRCSYEREIRLNPNKFIKIEQIYDEINKKLLKNNEKYYFLTDKK